MDTILLFQSGKELYYRSI